MSPSTKVIFQQLYDTENSVLVSALRGDLSDLQGRVKKLMVLKKSLWKQISQAKDKQLVLEARKSFSNKALQILSGKLSDAKATEELKEKAGAYFKESHARKAAQEVNKGQAGGGVAAINLPIVAVDSVVPEGPVSPAALPSQVALVSPAGPSSKPGTVLVSTKHRFPNKNGENTLPKLHLIVLPFPASLNINPSPCSLSPAPAFTLAPIAGAEEPNNDKAAQLKEDSTIVDDSALISNPITIVTNSVISSRSATKSVAHTGHAASITNLAIATDSVISTRPAAIITNSTITTRPAASNESTVPTHVETITGHLMDVDITGPALPHLPDEIVP
ncbi:hypothetical protein E4T56_gene19328 [Termitomyces sp. T112]|nr:hypothetical protein E4T56_gene19328 [Termitomyces sp. T112]